MSFEILKACIDTITTFKKIIELDKSIIPYASQKAAPIRLTNLNLSISFIINEKMTRAVAIHPIISKVSIICLYLVSEYNLIISIIN